MSDKRTPLELADELESFAKFPIKGTEMVPLHISTLQHIATLLRAVSIATAPEIISTERERCARLAEKWSTQNYEAEVKQAARAKRFHDIGMPDKADQAERFALELASAGSECEALAVEIRKGTLP